MRIKDEQIDLSWLPNFTCRKAEILAEKMLERNVKPEQDRFRVIYCLIENGLAKEPHIIQLVLRVGGGELLLYKSLINALEQLPSEQRPIRYRYRPLGPFQTPQVTMAIVIGLYVRAGMEATPSTKEKSNAQLVERVARIANEVRRLSHT